MPEERRTLRKRIESGKVAGPDVLIPGEARIG